MHSVYRKFDFDGMDDSECLAEFCFHKSDIPVLLDILHLPQTFICRQGTKCDGIEEICIALRTAAYSCRYSDLIRRFGRPLAKLSMISNLVLDTIYRQHHHRFTQWNNTVLSPLLLEVYAHTVQQKGSPLSNCFSFIDGMVHPICRPRENQRIVYNGHKRVHALKFQSVALPSGLIANMYGPVGN